MERTTSIEFRGLKAFAHVAQVGSFGRASRDLGITQSGLTRQVQRLEQGLGTPLFFRHSRGATLTNAGLRLLECVEEIIHLLTGPFHQSLPSGQVRTTLVLGYPPELAALLIPPVAERCRAHRPNMIISLQEDLGSSLINRILAGQVDVGVMYDPPNLDQLRICRLIEEPLLVVGPPRLPLSNISDRIDIRKLSGLPLFLPGEHHSHRRLIMKAAVRHGLRLRLSFEVESLPMRKALVRQGLGYAILPFSAVIDEISRGVLCLISIGRASLTSSLAIVSRKDANAAEDVLLLREILRSETEALVKKGVWLRGRLP